MNWSIQSLIYLTLVKTILSISSSTAVATYLTHVYTCTSSQFWNGQRCVTCYDPNGTCKTAQTTLTGCVSTYYLSTVNGVKTCLPCPTNCSSCLLNTLGMNLICTQCVENTQLIQGTCQYIPNCSIVNITLGICVQCITGYYMNESSECSPCDVSCTTCLESNICSTCSAGYSFLNTAFTCTLCDTYTFAVTTNCNTCAQSDTKYQCTSCLPGYYYNSNKFSCTQCPDNCQTCTMQSNVLKCLICQSSSNILQNIAGQCLSCIDSIQNCQDCALVNDNLVCINCLKTFYYNSSTNTCEQCPFQSICNCGTTSCTTATITIVQCPEGMNLLNGQCVTVDSTGGQVANCDYLTSTTACQTCQSSYYLAGTTCTLNTDANCEFFQYNIQSCLLCKTDYYLYNNACQQIQSMCLTQIQPGKCTLYQNNWYELNGVPTQCTLGVAEPCGFLEQSGSTITCNTAGKSVYQCKEYDQTSSGCLVWEKGTRNCAVCNNAGGFYLNSTTKKCGVVQDQCLAVKAGTTKCSLCSASGTQYFVEYYGVCVVCADQASGIFKCTDSLSESIDRQTNSNGNTGVSNQAQINKAMAFIFIFLQIVYLL